MLLKGGDKGESSRQGESSQRESSRQREDRYRRHREIKRRERDTSNSQSFSKSFSFKRTMYWVFIGKYDNVSYKEYVKNLDSNTKVWGLIKDGLYKDVDLIKSKDETMKHEYIVFKDTLKWFLNRRKPK